MHRIPGQKPKIRHVLHLQEATPAEIPVEVNAELEFAINLQVAKVLELTLAPAVVFRADRLIR